MKERQEEHDAEVRAVAHALHTATCSFPGIAVELREVFHVPHADTKRRFLNYFSRVMLSEFKACH
jgi:hypothetical protein